MKTIRDFASLLAATVFAAACGMEPTQGMPSAPSTQNGGGTGMQGSSCGGAQDAMCIGSLQCRNGYCASPPPVVNGGNGTAGAHCGSVGDATCTNPLQCVNAYCAVVQQGGNGTQGAQCGRVGDAMCTSPLVCDAGYCKQPVTAPSCNDGIQNGSENGIDCGGSCNACPVTPPPGSFVVEVSCSQLAEAHVYSADLAAPTTKSQDTFGNTTYTVALSRVEACTWGVEFNARVARAVDSSMPWYGLSGTPSLSTCTVRINGAIKVGQDNPHPWSGSVNKWFTPANIGC